MKIIKTKLHGLFDYVIVFFPILPFVSGFHARGEDTWILALMAAVILGYSLITDYEFGIFKLLPMKLHLFLDILAGLVLVIMPLVLTLHNYYFYWPVAIGIVNIAIAVLSYSKPYVVTRHD